MPHNLIAHAQTVCRAAHAGQERDGGTPYATHPEAVVEKLKSVGVTDEATLAAAYLHDVLEDTDYSAEKMQTEFGSDVVELVQQLTNTTPHGAPFEQKQAALLEHARKMSTKARLIKLADRWHNLTQMTVWPADKQQRYARAALELVVALKPWPNESLAKEVCALARRYSSCAGEGSGAGGAR